MRKILSLTMLVLTILHSPFTNAQEIPVSSEQQLENLTHTDEQETEDDAWLQDLEHFRKQPLNMNSAVADELRQLRIINDLQIASFMRYRSLLGLFISVYELQSVPAWDIVTIKKLLPFITVSSPVSVKDDLSKRFRNGEHSILLRVSQVLEQPAGYDRSGGDPLYKGSPQRILFRYSYNYKNLLQFGLLGDKDAGEQFLKGAQKTGFDFYSAHFFLGKTGMVHAMALGDFTVNLGQGLIHWQSLAFKKSADVTALKRQSAVLRPYSSAGEFFFHRGAGITVRKGKFESTIFISFRKLSANLTTDTVSNENHVSSILSSGYHRTENELSKRNKLSQTAFGMNISYKKNGWHAGINAVAYRFSLPLKKREEPYNLYAPVGKEWFNLSADYSYTFKNIHFFGETALDKQFNRASIYGILLSADPKADISLLFRSIRASYQAIAGNAFTENTLPTNETGIYTGIALRPAAGWRIDAYADVFSFPWLKYQTDAPGRGSDHLVQFTFTPNKQAEIYTRYRGESKMTNRTGNTATTNFPVFLPRQSWRTHISYKVSSSTTLRCRAELLWYDKIGSAPESGYLFFTDVIYKPLLQPFSGSVRLQYFETDGYRSRVYAYENDVLYSYSIPALYGKGLRYYLNMDFAVTRQLVLWVRWAKSTYRKRSSMESGQDALSGNRRSEIRFQARWCF